MEAQHRYWTFYAAIKIDGFAKKAGTKRLTQLKNRNISETINLAV